MVNHAHPTPELERVLQDVTEERKRQVAQGYTPEHDDAHNLADFVRFTWQRLREAADTAPVFGAHRRKRIIQAIAILVAAVEAMDRRAA